MIFLFGAALLICAAALHFVGLYTGIYETQMREGLVWYDNVLHMLVGVGFGLIGLSILTRVYAQAGIWLRLGMVFLFVFAMAIAWELLEYAFYMTFRSGALGLKVYSPTLQEAVFDSTSNLVGAGLVAVLVWLRRSTAPVQAPE